MSVTLAKPNPIVSTSNRAINTVAVLGAGIMGSRIALHFANIGVKAILLDIAPQELTPDEQKQGLTLDDPKVRNRIVQTLFKAAVDSRPAPVYEKHISEQVILGNFNDDLHKVAEADWIIEVVVERLDIKQSLYQKIEAIRRPGTLITSNTSGIPMAMLTQGRTHDFKRHFAGTHFFNPPRYLPLLEIIPAPETDPEVIRFLMHYGDLFLGKKTVLCKDTPAFIANRVGIYAIMDLFHLVEKYKLTVEEVDTLTGPLIGRAKSATFRTCDLVGLDTAIKVAKGIGQNCPNDERQDAFQIPAYVQYMVDNNMWGDKSGKGFYQKNKNPQGETIIEAWDFQTQSYRPQNKVTSALLESVKSVDQFETRFKMLLNAKEKYADFLRESFYGLFAYVSHRVPEIADDLYNVDAGMQAGFGWNPGPFTCWDAVGVRQTVDAMKSAGFKVAAWVETMLSKGCESFYKIQNGIKHYYDLKTETYQPIPGATSFIILDHLRESRVIWHNTETTLFDLGDGVLNLEFNSKMNTLGGEVIAGINRAIDVAEQSYHALIIGNQGENFSVGANLALVLTLALEQEWDDLNFAVQAFQRTSMRLRYSSIPVVVSPHGMTLGGGCELSMHADHAVAAAETYIGLVEVGVGLIPGGGGTKEFALRLSDRYAAGDVEINALSQAFMTIGQAKVSTSAHEAFGLGYLQKHKDHVVINKDRLLTEAKRVALERVEAGYTMPQPRKDIRVLGKSAHGAVYAGAFAMQYAGYATEHDRLIAEKIGFVLCGGNLSVPTLVSEQYLLDLEREAFLSLLGERKTLERIQHMLKTGKPLRN